MTDPLAEIKARLAAATPGPWFRSPQTGIRLDGMSTVRARDGNRPVARIRSVDRDELWPDPDAQTEVDAEFIAHAPADITRLASKVEHLHELLARLEWVGASRRSMANTCPACHGWPANGHYPDCWLAKELGLPTRAAKP